MWLFLHEHAHIFEYYLRRYYLKENGQLYFPLFPPEIRVLYHSTTLCPDPSVLVRSLSAIVGYTHVWFELFKYKGSCLFFHVFSVVHVVSKHRRAEKKVFI